VIPHLIDNQSEDDAATAQADANASPSNRRDWKFHAERINAAWGKRVESVIETGQALLDAQNEPEGRSFRSLVESSALSFSRSTAIKLMKIAEHPILSSGSHVNQLPESWGTLYELTRLPIEVLRAKLKDGSINPKTERKDVAEWRAETRGKIEVGGKPVERKPSPYTQMKMTNVTLQEELNKALTENREMRTANDGGNYFTADSSGEHIANSVANLLRTSPAKMREVARLLNKLAKEFEERIKTARPVRRKRGA
jgi:hypothetical protein